MSEVFIRTVAEGKKNIVNLPWMVMKQLDIKEGDSVEFEVVNGEMTIRKALVIEVLPVVGLTLQRIHTEGKNFDIMEIYNDSAFANRFHTIYKGFVNENLMQVELTEIEGKANLDSFVRDLIKDGFEIY